jgi:hypothetical protein
MDSEADIKSGTSSMQVDSDEYSDSCCDYGEFNEGWLFNEPISIFLILEDIYGVDEKPKELPECSHISKDPEVIPYECLTVSQVDKMVKDWVSDVMHVLSVTPSQAKLLLQLNNWDLDKIKQEANANLEEFLIKNGLKVKSKQQPKTERRTGMQLRSKIAKKEKQQSSQCGVCWEDDIELIALDCGHNFCSECWPNHIKAQVEQSKSYSLYFI